MDHKSKPLEILRTIAETKTTITIKDAVKTGNICLVNLVEQPATAASFTYACTRGFTDIVRLLLDRGADPAADDNAAICSAIRNGQTEIVRLLLDLGVDPEN
jgi:ankyrin repeat protein